MDQRYRMFLHRTQPSQSQERSALFTFRWGPSMYSTPPNHSQIIRNSFAVVVVLLAGSVLAVGQAAKAQEISLTRDTVLNEPAKAQPAKARDGEGNVIDRVAALEEALRAQSAKLEEMQKLIIDQQHTIETLAKSGSSASRTDAPSAPAVPEVVSTTAQKPTLEDRV